MPTLAWRPDGPVASVGTPSLPTHDLSRPSSTLDPDLRSELSRCFRTVNPRRKAAGNLPHTGKRSA